MFHYVLRLTTYLRHAKARRADGVQLILTVVLLIVLGTIGFYFTEHDAALADVDGTVEKLRMSAWWTVVTMTTVGYGDFYPSTWAGQWLVAVPIMVLGIGVLGYAIGVVTSVVIDFHSKEARGMVPYTGQGHLVICNCPSAEVVEEVMREIRADEHWKGHDLVLVTDAFEELPERLSGTGVSFVSGNPGREATLEKANITKAERVMILGQDPSDVDCDAVTLGVLVTVRALAPEVYVVAECISEENHKLLRNAGVSEVVAAGSLRAEMLVQGLLDPGVSGLLQELLSNTTGNQFYLTPLQQFSGSYGELDEQSRSKGYLLMGYTKDGERHLLPAADSRLDKACSAILVGKVRPDWL
ncbi:potassium channel family protein [Planctomycetota bacterium]|nr:potassium channel family protein [Planctomycetota bacterium]